MWRRLRAIQTTRTRRAARLPAVAANVSALIGEALEDRTLLSGDPALDGSGETWADLLKANELVQWFMPADVLALVFAAENVLDGEASVERAVADMSAEFVVQLPADARWQDFVKSASGGEPIDVVQPSVFVVVEWAASSSGKDAALSGVADVGLVNVTVRFAASGVASEGQPPMQESLVSTDASSRNEAVSSEVTDELIPTVVNAFPMTEPADVVSAIVPTDTDSELQSIIWIQGDHYRPMSRLSLSEVLPAIRQSAASQSAFESLGFELAMFETDIGLAKFRTMPVSVGSVAGATLSSPLSGVGGGANDVAIARALLEMADSGPPEELAAIVKLPWEGIQAAAQPVTVVLESILASIGTAAQALLGLLTGASSGSSPVAPIVEPILDSTHTLIDPKRPRWALHDGVAEELAAYSLVVAPDQHFDLRDFGPAASAADPVVRIEFEVGPQHGVIAAGSTPGTFRYSADPGFSGVDHARFRVTRASGRSVAGSVTVVVDDSGDLGQRPNAVQEAMRPGDGIVPVVELGFRLSGVWMDLP